MPRDREKLLAKRRRHYRRHKSELLKKSRARYAANPAPAVARAKVWAENNPDKVNVKKRRQRKERKEQLALAAVYGKEFSPAAIVAKSLVHKARLRAFLAGRTTAPLKMAKPAPKPKYTGKLTPGGF